MMFYEGRRTEIALSPRVMWALMVANLANLALLGSIGPVLDGLRITSIVTFGGHHKIVMAFSALGFVLIAAVAIMTTGFQAGNEVVARLAVAAAIVSLVSLVGLLSLLAVLLVVRFIAIGALRSAW